MLADDIAAIVERVTKANPDISSIRAHVKEHGKRAWIHIEVHNKLSSKSFWEHVIDLAPYLVVLMLAILLFLWTLDLPGCWKKHVKDAENHISITNRYSAGVLHATEISETMKLIEE